MCLEGTQLLNVLLINVRSQTYERSYPAASQDSSQVGSQRTSLTNKHEHTECCSEVTFLKPSLLKNVSQGAEKMF